MEKQNQLHQLSQQTKQQTLNYKNKSKSNKNSSFNLHQTIQNVINSQIQEKQRLQFIELFPTNNGNDIRQKIKIWKKIMTSNNKQSQKQKQKEVQKQKQRQKIQQMKLIINKYLAKPLVQQYVFGDLQAKHLMINLLRQLNLQPLSITSIQAQIKQFQQIKHLVEVYQIIEKQKVNDQLLQKDLQQIFQILLKYFKQGQQMISKNQFRTKWLDNFVEILRSINSIIRIAKNLSKQLIQQQLLKRIQNCLSYYQLLSKEVLTQLYLVLIFISPNQAIPSENIRIIHYLNAKAIIQNQKTLSKLLPMIQTLKDTQHKIQLAPILLKAFQLQFSTYQDKNNAFDQVIQLFESGRSVYNYLQGIISIILKQGGAWNLQGNIQRKFFTARILLKHVKPDQIIKQWSTFLSDAIQNSGSLTVAYSAQCAQSLLQKLYIQNNQNYQKWSQIWMPSYLKAIQNGSRTQLRGLIEFTNPAIVRICPKPILLQQLLNNKNYQNNTQLPLISLLKCYRDSGKILFKQDSKSFCFINNINNNEQKNDTINQNNLIIQLKFEDMRNMLLSGDLMVVYKALQFLAHLQKPSELLNPLQYELLLFFFKNSMKTSNAQFRQNYLTVTKKLFDRLRTNYDKQITNKVKKSKQKEKPFYQQMKNFMKQLIKICFQYIYVEAIYQVIQPALQILILATNYFGNQQKQVKKGQFLMPTTFLQQHTSFYQFSHFQNLLICLQSSYESIRNSASIILNTFTQLTQQDLLQKLWKQSLVLTNKLGIRHYEFACRIVSFLSKRYYDKISEIPKIHKNMKTLNVCQCLLKIMKDRYKVFTQQFSKQSSNFYKNLIHGLLTCFSYLFEEITNQINDLKSQLKQNQWLECCQLVKDFMDRFMQEVNQILLFSVQISSSNISTVVLDTLMPGVQQNSQNKGMKVDCRGHFLPQKNQQNISTIGKYLQSTALMPSMENQQQGIQNTLVVSFYLLTRQAGLVFQSLSTLLNSSDSLNYLPVSSLATLINAYFYALINLKHMGSVDRISIGLSKMSRVIFKHQNVQLAKLPQGLLNKLLDLLQEGQFTNILRRSAGVPYAFSCLLKSQAIKRKSLIDKTISTLINLANSITSATQLKIHSLNILKKLFQDADLKQDLDPFLSKAFITSMKGFSSEDWNIRNSSLMLFSTLANRTIGIKPTYNLLQFFHKCPDMLPYMQQQLQKPFTGVMYPSLYPLVLLLSRLLPFDLKQKARMTIKGQNSIKQLRKQQLLKLLPLVQKAGDNNNYMGRAMTAKAILPFMELSSIIPYCLNIIKNCPNKTMNSTHYDLLRAYHLLVSYHEITQQNQTQQNSINPELLLEIIDVLISKTKLLSKLKCPTVQQVLIKIYNQLFLLYDKKFRKYDEKYKKLITIVEKQCAKILKQYMYSQQYFIIQQDLGTSKLRLATIILNNNLMLGCNSSYFERQPNFNQLQFFINFLVSKIDEDSLYLTKIDTQVISQYINQVYVLIEKSDKYHNKVSQIISKLINKVTELSILPDTILVSLLKISKILKIDLGSMEYLQKLAHTTKNTKLQVELFKYIFNHGLPVDDLLYAFSSPDQLEQLRVCCVQYLEQQKQINPKHYLVYIRLLQDQQPQIRKAAGYQISRCLKIYEYNEAVIKNNLLAKLTKQQFRQLMLQNTDYQIKKKNNAEQRIFSYDKPNKFRSDIQTTSFIIANNKNLTFKEIKEIITEINNKQNLQQFNFDKYLNDYNEDILARNQLKFQNVLRAIVLEYGKNEQTSKQCQLLALKHPIFDKVYRRFLQSD